MSRPHREPARPAGCSGSVTWPGSDAAARHALDHVLAGRPALGDSRLLCVEGPSGSGKTTVSRAMARAWRDRPPEALPGSGRLHRVALDAVYPGWEGLAAGVALLAERLLAPLSSGRAGTLPTWDWVAGRPGPLRDVPPVDLLLLEGCGAGDRTFTAWTTTLVWLDAPAPTRLARAVARDGEPMRARLQTWQALEGDYYAAQRPWERADLAWSTTVAR